MAKKKLTDKRRWYIEEFMRHAEDLPDGAYFAMAEECGITIEELAVMSEKNV